MRTERRIRENDICKKKSSKPTVMGTSKDCRVELVS